MGLTCASIHVFARDVDEALPSAIDRVIHGAVQRLGFEPVEQPAVWEWQIVAFSGPSWYTVLDERSPGLITESLIDLAREISGTAGPTLIVSVYDSDAFAFLLFERGKQVDAYASDDNLLSITFKKWSAKKRVQEWSRVFGKALTLADFNQVLEPAGPFADDQLLSLCQLLGISIDLATMNWKDLDQTPSVAFRRFAFRSRGSAGSGLDVKQVIPSGMDAAVVAQHTGQAVKEMPLYVGECGHLSLEMSGPAETFVDPVLEVRGPAVEMNLVELAGSGTWHGGTIERIKAGEVVRAEALWEAAEFDGRRVLRGRLQGLRARGRPFPRGHVTKLALGLQVRGASVGVGEFQVVCHPNDQGAAPVSLFPVCRADVSVPKWIPRNCKQGTTSADQGLRALNTSTVLSAVVILKDDDDAATARVRPLLRSGWVPWESENLAGCDPGIWDK